MVQHWLRASRALGVFAIPAALMVAVAAVFVMIGVGVFVALGVATIIVVRYLSAPKPEPRGTQTIIPPRLSRPRWRPFRSEPAGFFSHDR